MEPNQPLSAEKKQVGCGMALFASVLWIGLVISVSQLATWLLEQALVEGTLREDPGRWWIGLVASIAIIVPFMLLSMVRNVVYRVIFRTWVAAGVVLLLMVPVRLISLTDSQGTTLMQCAGMSLVIIVVRWWLRRKGDRSNPQPVSLVSPVVGLALAFLLGIPWAINGALGSWLDTLLSLVAGLTSAAVIYLILKAGLLQLDEFKGEGHVLLKGLIVSQILVIFSGALGLNGNEWVLLLILPMLGWLAGFWVNDLRWNNYGLIGLVGLGIAWPLMWVDPDELSLIISLAEGDLIGWTAETSLIALVLILILVIISGVWAKVFPGRRMGLKWGSIGAILAGAMFMVLFLVYGTPGFYGEKLFVILKEQADLSSIQDSLTHNQRRLAVYRALVEQADKSQTGIRGNLSALGIRYQPYYLVNALEVDAGPIVKLILSLNPSVERVLDSPVLRPLPEDVPVSTAQSDPPSDVLWNLQLIGADRVWQEFKVRGKGIVIGQSDSGVEGEHPELKANFRGKENSDYAWLDPWNSSKTPVDFNGHGTHTLGTILGRQVGVAPDAEWIGCVNLARNLGNPAIYLDCMQFMLAPYPRGGDPFEDGDPSRGAHVLNNSWGCPEIEGCDPNVFLPAVRALRKAGVFVVVSAGNTGMGGCGSVDSPLALYDEVYSVGSIERNGERSSFSSLGPVQVDGSLRIKPDILAPGGGIFSSYTGLGYNTIDGTSMAGPHVVGVVALMWSANPKLIGDIDRTEWILNKSAKPYQGATNRCGAGVIPNNTSGFGIVDAYAAVKAALDLQP